MDPDDFIKNFGAKELEKIFDAAPPLSESLFEFALTELAIDRGKKISAENKAKLEANLTAKIAAIQDQASKKYFSLFFKDLLFSIGRGQKKSPEIFSKITLLPPRNLADYLSKNIIAFIVKFPELAQFRDDIFDIKESFLSSEKLTHLKELLIENEGHDLAEFKGEMLEIENIVASLEGIDLESVSIRFRLLLLKDLLLQVEAQCRESLGKINEAETHKTAITDQRIKEIFDYKNSLQAMILAAEKELI
jgi:DNA primase